jgi:hypothetical protein
MRRLLVTMVTLLLAAMAAFAPATTQAQGGQGFVSIMHASPDAPAVDVYVNGSRVLNDVPFFAASPYLPLDAGSYDVAVTAAGDDIADAVIQGTLTLNGGEYVTVAAVNTLDNIEAVAFVDNLSTPPAGQARVSVIHASPDAPAVDIKLAGTSDAVASGLAFKQSVELEVPAGTYTFDISPAGSSDVVFTTPALRFENGWVYTLVATGEIGEGGFWVQSVVDKIGE